LNERLYDLARSQHGLVSRKGAFASGLTQNDWHCVVASKAWTKIYAGVYRLTGMPRTFEQTVMAGCLAANGVATGRTAAILWKLPEIPQHLELAIGSARRSSLPDFEIHRLKQLPSSDRTLRQRIPCTALPRTVLDVCLVMPQRAPGLVDHVLARRNVPLTLLIARLDAMGVKGRKGAGELMELLQVRQGRERHVDSGLQRKLEEIAMAAYRAGLLPKPAFECPIRVGAREWRFADTAHPPIPVAFEAVGYLHHETIEDFCNDRERNLELFGEGWVIVPVTKGALANPARLVSLMGRILMNHGWEGPAVARVD